MKTIRYILAFVLLYSPLGALCTWSQDFTRLSERTIMGTARYVGMGGAMTAIGGDPSASLDNPAGLGLYRRWEVLLTMTDLMFDRTQQITSDGMINPSQRRLYMVPQASVVFCLPTYNPDDQGVQYHNLLFSSQRVHTYNRTYSAGGVGDPSLGALLATTSVNWDIPFCADANNVTDDILLRESGYVNEYSFDYAMNIKNQWYVGIGLRMQSYLLSADATYYEEFATFNADRKRYANTNTTALQYSAVSCNMAVGLIYRPTKWLRMGVGFQTPTIGSLTTYTSGTLTAMTDSLRSSYAPNCQYNDKAFHMPLHLSTSLAFQLSAYGMLSFQYDYRHAKYVQDTHSLRAGLEIIPVMGMYVNAGYVYESTFNRQTTIVPMDPTFDRQDTYFFQPRWTQYVSCAIGYRGSAMIVQAAYQYRWQRTDLYAHEDIVTPYNMHTDTHRLVITLGWHSN